MIFTFFLAILATYRVAYFIVNENGPWDFMFNIRTWFTNKSIDYITELDDPDDLKSLTIGGTISTIDDMISCPYCVGFWTALAAAVFVIYAPLVLLPFAIAGGAHIIERVIQIGERDED